ncbi:hypothetical protein [Streptomyces canarius]
MDFRFSQDENYYAVQEVADGASGASDWVPTLADYLYVSVTNSTASSPTDTMPLSTRAKAMMSVQSVSALYFPLGDRTSREHPASTSVHGEASAATT